MEASPEGAWRSFAAAFVCLPAFLLMRLAAWDASADPSQDDALRPLLAELIGYTLAWSGFALISLPLAQAWGRGNAWPRFIAAWNWTNVVQYAVLLALLVPGLLGLPAGFAQILTLLGLGYAVWLEWFVTRHALGVEGTRAAIMVGVDLALGLFLTGLIRSLSS
jgi:hypothetical protein